MNTQDFETMVADYVSDPNCRPELWVSYETPIQSERDAFCKDERVKAAFSDRVKVEMGDIWQPEWDEQ